MHIFDTLVFKESYLTRQHLHPPTLERFSLDSIGNAILCECIEGQFSLND